MRLVAQYNVQAELAPHEEESRRQEGQLIIFFSGCRKRKKGGQLFFLSVAGWQFINRGKHKWAVIFFMFVDVNGKQQGS